MEGLVACIAQSRRQCGRKLGINQKQHASFCRNNRMIRLTRGKGQYGVDVVAFQIRVILQDLFARLFGRQQPENIGNCHTQSANAWTTVHSFGVDRDSRQ